MESKFKLVKIGNLRLYEVSETELGSNTLKNLLNSGKILYNHYSTGNYYYKIL